jgi:hypothetical protein
MPQSNLAVLVDSLLEGARNEGVTPKSASYALPIATNDNAKPNEGVVTYLFLTQSSGVV